MRFVEKKKKKVYKVTEEVKLGDVILEVGDEFIYLDDEYLDEEYENDEFAEYYPEEDEDEDEIEEDYDYDRPRDYFSNMRR